MGDDARSSLAVGADRLGAGSLIAWRALCALVVALAVQIGTNYANDYSDGIRGTDAARVGPLRLVASGLASPATVRAAAFCAFGVAGVAGLALAAATTWWLVPVGAACMAAGWLYTGGPRPYGYLGLGEVFVFVFFGVVATAGSAFVQYGHLLGAPVAVATAREHFDWLLALWAAVPVGLLATALLEANNLRDIDGDALAQKRTLAVRLVAGGPDGSMWVRSCSLPSGSCWSVSFARGLCSPSWRCRWPHAPCAWCCAAPTGGDLLPVLGATGRLQLAVGLLLALGIVV